MPFQILYLNRILIDYGHSLLNYKITAHHIDFSMVMPAAHGVDGATFGYLVSNLARMYPGAVADHVK
jgi:hypothetical protein